MIFFEFKVKHIKILENKKLLTVIAIFILSSNLTSYLFISNANAQMDNSTTSYKSTQSACRCVIFRLDDTNSDFLTTVQLSVLNQFIAKNQSLSLGLIMHKINQVSPITEKIAEGQQKGLFELDIHGWDHVDYTQLSQEEQLETLQQASSKMHMIFGQYSQVFIPPYNRFDGDTIGILKSVGIKIFSADTSSDKASYFVQNGKNIVTSNPTLYHLPAMTTFKRDNGNGTWIKVPIPTILNQIDAYVDRYGYAVVLLHPQNFAKLENNVYVDVVAENEIQDLSSLIDSVKSKNLRITTFAGVTGLTMPVSSSHVQTIPEFHGIESIALVLSILIVIGFTTLSKNRSVVNGF